MRIVRTDVESVSDQFVGLQAECPRCQFIIEIETPDDVKSVKLGYMFQRRAAVAICPNCEYEVTFREGDTAWRELEAEGDDGADGIYWVRAEDEAYALKEAYRHGVMCFATRDRAEQADTNDALYRVVVTRFPEPDDNTVN